MTAPTPHPDKAQKPASSAGRKPVMQCTDGEWRGMVSRLRACCPPPDGFSWQLSRSRRVGPDATGDCLRQRNGVIRVRVAHGLSPTETLDTLMHEMAHGYDMWTHHRWADEHGDTFWIWLGRIYRAFHQGYVS